MIPSASVSIGITALRANPLRTTLSTLGVIIGVASLVAILALGDGLERFSRAQLETTTSVQFVSVDARTLDFADGVMVRRRDVVTFRPADAESLAVALDGLGDPLLTITGSGYVRLAGDTASHVALVTAAQASMAALYQYPVAAGRFLADADTARAPVPAVAAASLAKALDLAPESLVGRPLDIDGRPHVVVGVLGGDAAGAPRVIVPLDAAAIARLGDGGRTAPSLLARARRVEDVDSVRARIERWLTARYGRYQERFTVSSSASRAAQARLGIRVFKLVMGSITGISILVGGIGIMNILLASVAERTREIGIRKAVGARRSDILVQFLAESVAISGFGALLGVGLGLGGAFGITALIRHTTRASIAAAFTWGTVIVAMVAAVLVGVVFGTYPARRAARLSPIDAIRHE